MLPNTATPSCWQQAGAAQDQDAACRLTSPRMEGLGWEHPELSAPKGPQESLEQGQRRSQPQGGGLGVGRRGTPPPVPPPPAACSRPGSPHPHRHTPWPLEVPLLPAPTCGSSSPQACTDTASLSSGLVHLPRKSRQMAAAPALWPGVGRELEEGDCLVSWLLMKVMGQYLPRKPLAGVGSEGCSPSSPGAEDGLHPGSPLQPLMATRGRPPCTLLSQQVWLPGQGGPWSSACRGGGSPGSASTTHRADPIPDRSESR